MKRIVITGARSWENQGVIKKVLEKIVPIHFRPEFLIIVGGAPGVDSITDHLCREQLGIHCAVIKPLWSHYSHSAGPKRNAVMLSLNPELVLGFHWDIENESKGTANCLKQAKERDIPTKLIKVPKKVAMPSGFDRKKK